MSDERERQEQRGLLFQYDNLLHQRIEFALVTQSVFFVAVATGWQAESLVIVLSALGIATISIFTIGSLKLYWRVVGVIEQLMRVDPAYRQFIHAEGLSRQRWGRPSRWLMKRLVPGPDGGARPPTWLDSGSLATWGLWLVCVIGWLIVLAMALSAVFSNS